jgi:predicted AlkP superfamily phosphohydrolase/phosphomutase
MLGSTFHSQNHASGTRDAKHHQYASDEIHDQSLLEEKSPVSVSVLHVTPIGLIPGGFSFAS